MASRILTLLNPTLGHTAQTPEDLIPTLQGAAPGSQTRHVICYPGTEDRNWQRSPLGVGSEIPAWSVRTPGLSVRPEFLLK